MSLEQIRARLSNGGRHTAPSVDNAFEDNGEFAWFVKNNGGSHQVATY